MVLADFDSLINDYKHNLSLNDKVKNYILNHFYTEENIKEYIDMFTEVAKEINDEVGYALSRGMYFWLHHGSNIELAHKYNAEALSLYRKIDNYKYKAGYLSILNNELIYNNYKANLYDSYLIMNEGMDIIEETKNINYFYSFAVNGFYLLLDLGLTDKAMTMLEKLEKNNVTSSNTDEGILIILKIKINYITDKKLALEYARKMLAMNEKELIFEPYLVYSYMLKALCLNSLDREADAMAERLLKYINDEHLTDEIDLSEAYIALARYYARKGNSEEAFKYYKLILPIYNNILGFKKDVITEACTIFKEHDQELYIKALEAKSKLLEEINKTFIVATANDKKMHDSFIDIRYEYLFDKMKRLTTFISKVDKLTDKDNISQMIEEGVQNILGAKKVKVIIENDELIYKGLDLSNVDNLKIFENEELPESIKHKYDCVAVIKISKDKVGDNLYIIIGFDPMGNLEKKENYYILSLTKETLTPLILQVDRYNEAVSNYSRDELTQLHNRYGLLKMLNDRLYHDIDSYLLMMDIDDFKKINDNFGHAEGDRVLIDLANTLKSILGDDSVARIGGEEFIGFINKDCKDINSKLDEIQRKVARILVGDKALTISIGVSTLNHDSMFNKVKDSADKALYKAKKNGKNQYVFDSELN